MTRRLLGRIKLGERQTGDRDAADLSAALQAASLTLTGASRLADDAGRALRARVTESFVHTARKLRHIRPLLDAALGVIDAAIVLPVDAQAATLCVRWRDGRVERFQIAYPGARVTLGERQQASPVEIEMRRPGAPTLAVVELHGDEIPAMVLFDKEADNG